MSVEPQGWTPSEEVTSGHSTQIHIFPSLSLSLSIPPSLRLILFRLAFSTCVSHSFCLQLIIYLHPSLSLSRSRSRPPTSSHFSLLLLCLFCPLSISMSTPSSLRLSLGGGRALLSSRPPRERLTSAGCGAKVVPLSLAAASGSLCI